MPMLVQWRSGAPAAAVALRLIAGDRQFGLYGLRSFVIVNRRVQVLLEPRSELGAIWAAWRVKPSRNRWVAPARSPHLIRAMEHGPVRAGLAQRPEQWRWSSAWQE